MEATALPPPKPLLRGVLHLVATFVALIAWVLLSAWAPTQRARWAALVYGATLTALFLISASYHRPTWSPKARAWMRRLDHSAIFLLIAGTYTPFCLLIRGPKGTWLLLVVWGGALFGIVKSLVWIRAPKPLTALLCVGLGWVAVPIWPEFKAAAGPAVLWLLLAGGLAYSAGAVVYAMKRPDPFPRVFGYHEVFHLLVVVAAVLQFAAVARALPALG